MGHEILGQRFIARKEPAWHKLGVVFPEEMEITASEAMRRVAGDVEVVRASMSYELDGQTHAMPKHRAIVRKPLPDDKEHRILGVTAESWVAASYTELASSLDELAKTYKVETAALLRKGGLALLSLRAPDWDVKGDPMRSYFVANWSLTPGVGHKMFHSPVRVVCFNTNTLAESKATINLAIPHSTDSIQRMQLAAKLVEMFTRTKNETKELFEAFADLHITQSEADSIFSAAYPEPEMPAKLKFVKQQLSTEEAERFKEKIDATLLQAIENAQEKYDKDLAKVAELRKSCNDRYEVFEPIALRGTAWAAYNAVTEIADWREGRNADEAVLVGSRAREKSRAFSRALKLVS